MFTHSPDESPEVEAETEPVDVCAGQCEKANQRCEVESGRAVCRCLEGYLDGESGDGSSADFGCFIAFPPGYDIFVCAAHPGAVMFHAAARTPN